MKKFLLILFVILLAYLTAYYTSGASEKQDLFGFGNSPFMYRIKCLFTGETDTTNANALYSRAENYFYLEEYEMAIKDYKKALEIDPTLEYVKSALARTYLEMKDTASAITFYKMMLNESQYPADAYSELAQLYLNIGGIDSATVYYEKALEFNPESHQINYQLAWINFENSNYEKALRFINKAIDLFTAELPYRNLRRRIYLKLNEKDLATNEYQYIIEHDPYFFVDYAQKAKEASEAEEYQKAIEYYKLALENQPDDIELLIARAWIYHKIGAYDSALIDFKQVAQISPDYYNYFNVAYTLDFLDSIKASIEYYDKSIKLKDDYYYAYNNRGYEYYKLKNYKKAEADYSKSIKLKSDYYLPYYNRGILYYDQKKYKKAIDDYKKAQKYIENDKNLLYDIALAYDKLKNKKEAIYYYNEFIKVATEASDSISLNRAVIRVADLSK